MKKFGALFVLGTLLIGLHVIEGCGNDSDDPADTDPNSDDPLDWEGGWTPEGLWGAEGDLSDPSGGDGDSDGDSDMDTDMDTDTNTDTDTDTDVPDGGTTDGGTKGFYEPVPKVEPITMYLSADDSNSQSSPVLIRSMIESGSLVQPSKIRIWEFFNYYDFSYETPSQDVPLAVSQQLRPYNIEEGMYALQIGVQGRSLTNENRRPLSITLILDTSGSMSGSPISLLKDTCRAIASSLMPGDRISMVTWNTSQYTPLESLDVDGPNDPQLLQVINAIEAGGGTDLHAGLVSGYALASQNFMEDGLNRVVLISDGGANAGETDANIIAQAAEGAEGEAIFMVGVGVGENTYYNDTLMDTVTDLGKGASIFVDSSAEADKMFKDRFLANMEVTAFNVRVEMTLPLFFDVDQFFGEEMSQVPSEVEPQHLAPNDAMIYQQLIKTSNPDEVYATDSIDLNVTYTDAITGQEGVASLSSTLQELVEAPCNELRKGDAIVVYAQALVISTNLSAEGNNAGAFRECTSRHSVVQESASVLGDADLEEIADLLELYCNNFTTN